VAALLATAGVAAHAATMATAAAASGRKGRKGFDTGVSSPALGEHKGYDIGYRPPCAAP
jgi:hypothetical protein